MIDIEDLELVLLEAVWLMRWNENKTTMVAILSEEEALQMCKDIVTVLEEHGYKIIRDEGEI